MAETPIAFFAYPSQDESIAKIIRDGIGHANSRLREFYIEPWEFNDIAGNPVISPILDRIEESCFVIADITYLNPNVVYEIGFAIGQNKRVYLVRHGTIDGDKNLAGEIGIFDTLGYVTYESAEGLSHKLTSHISRDPLPYSVVLDTKAPVYVVEPIEIGAVETMMTSRLKKARYRYRSFNPAEDARISAADAIRQCAISSGILLSLQDPASSKTANIHNIRSMFVAGLGDGMGKPAMILAPINYAVPLDVRDEVKRYQFPDDITDHVHDFALEVTDYLQQINPPPVSHATLLQSLRIGDPTAENEMTTLAMYYLYTDEYRRALQGDVNLVVGRKGSGKTALFVQLRDVIRDDKRNIVVDLKPEGYQVIKLKEEILSYITEGTRQHLITAFWEYLLLLEVAYKILEKDHKIYKHNHEIRDLYLDLKATYEVPDFSSEGDFSERLLFLSQKIADDYKAKFSGKSGVNLSAQEITQLIYSHDIRALRERISKYLERKQSVWILFDNLDKGWRYRWPGSA